MGIAVCLAIVLVTFVSPPHAAPKEGHRVGLLGWAPCDGVGFDHTTPEWAPLLTGMVARGYGRDGSTEIVCRSADRDPAKVDAAAEALIAENVDVIVVLNNVTAWAALRHTNSVWIIARMQFPDGSMALPRGYLSGVFDPSFALTGKRLELLRDTVSGLRHVGVLYRPDLWQRHYLAATRRGAEKLSLDLSEYPIKSIAETDAAFERMAADGVQAVFLLPDPMIEDGIAAIADLSAKRALPTMGWDTAQAGEGLLMAYSSDSGREEERLAYYVDEVLRGRVIGNEPLGQPSVYTLAIDLGTADRMGLIVPPAVLLFAAELIE